VKPAPRIACSETALNLPVLDAWDLAQRCGVDAIEIYGAADEVAPRRQALHSARRGGVRFSAICLGPPFLGRVAGAEVAEAIAMIKEAISVAAEIEASAVVVAIAAPPSVQSSGEFMARIVESLEDLACHGGSAGVAVLVEPLNRYEDGLVNRLEQAARLCDHDGTRALGVAADFFHMNIEERDLAEAICTLGSVIRLVHLADSNRRQPGAGHLDFMGLIGALRSVEFDGWLSLECSLDDPIDRSLRAAADLVKSCWEEHAAAAASPAGSRPLGWSNDASSSSSVTPGSAAVSTSPL
jgi:sugar phosphate isomerase/epimerase